VVDWAAKGGSSRRGKRKTKKNGERAHQQKTERRERGGAPTGVGQKQKTNNRTEERGQSKSKKYAWGGKTFLQMRGENTGKKY